MEMLKDRVYQLIVSHKKGNYDIEKLAKELGCTSTADFVLLNKALNELEDEYMIVRNSQDRFLTLEQSNCVIGKLRVNKNGYGFIDIDDDNSIFITRDEIRYALDMDEVLVQVTPGTTQGRILKVLKHGNDLVVGIITRNMQLSLDDRKLANKRVKILNRNEFNLVAGLKVQAKIVGYGEILKVNIVRIIGHINDPGVDISSILIENNIKLEFNPETLEHANMVESEVSEEEKKNRRDLRDKLIVTIDGDDSKDFDDAISIEKLDDGFMLGVHIADVSYYVTQGSPLDDEAYERGTSVYVADRVVPMLPHVLSNGICSLNPNEDRLAITCDMKINYAGEVVNYELYPSVIQSKYRMTYNNVNKILNHDEELSKQYADIKDIFFVMQECSSVIRERRMALGAIDFEKEEAKVVVDKKGRVVDIVVRERNDAEKLIEDFMICANECVARLMKWSNLPSIYRIHEKPKAKKLKQFTLLVRIMGYRFKGDLENVHPKDIQKCLDNFKDEETYPIISTLMLRSMKKARYDARCIGHFGLASEEYLHFTSPIRRYPDLIVHRMLRRYYFEKDFSHYSNDEELVNDIALNASDCEVKATQAERDVLDMKKAEYMQNFIGRTFDGIISSVNSFGFFVEIGKTIEGLVHVSTLSDDHYHFDEDMLTLVGERTARTYTLGQKIKVKVIRANKVDRTIDFEVLRPRKKKKKMWK